MHALLSFFTVYPVGRATLEKAAASAYLLPLIGLMTGLPGAAVLLGLGSVIPAGVAASLALVAALFAAGFHHTDGLLDVGDALMVRSGPERRREVMKDLRVGAGGVAAVLAVYAPAFAALSAMVEVSPALAAFALLAAEAASRSAMLSLLVFGEPAEAGSSSAPFAAALRHGRSRYAGLALALVLPATLALPLGYVSLLTLVWLPAAGGVLWISARAFGGIGGDVSGAAGEAVRALVLIALSAGLA